MRLPHARRPGFGLMALLIALGIVTILLGSITLQVLINRKTLARHERRLQALWLARAGLEVAAAKVLDGADDYTGETVTLMPAGTVRIQVQREKQIFRVTSEATYAINENMPIVREVSRSYRLVGEGKQLRLVVIGKTGDANSR